MLSMRFVCRLALPVVVLVGLADAASAQSQDVQQACTPDAMRLCGQFIPDRDKVTACMKAHHREWSEACRLAASGGRRVEGRRRVYRHHGTRHEHYRHYRHHHHEH
jgi:hypothetical protein